MSFAREMMSMRAELQRNTASTDTYGGPGKPGYTLVKDGVQCYVWSKTKQRIMEGRIAEVEEIGAIFPDGTDVQTLDRIEQFKNRKGDVLMDGPFEVVAVTERHDGQSIHHIEAKLRRVS